DSAQNSVVMAAAPSLDGHIVLLATALDVDWTNLPTKPLFVPLIHETLRGLLGAPAEMARMNATVCGDTPWLGKPWDAAQELTLMGQRVLRLALRRTDRGLESPGGLEVPGVYAARPTAVGRRLPANPDADAGDTRAIESAVLEQWLRGIGAFKWID